MNAALALNGATIGTLFFSRRPTAVAWLVIAVVVDAVERQARRRFAHVCIETFKAQPAITDLNPAPPIIGICTAMGIKAPGFHRTPDAINRGPSFAVGESRFDFVLTATARERVSSREVVCKNRYYLPTATKAFPARKAFARWGSSKDSQITKLSSGHVRSRIHELFVVAKKALINMIMAQR